MNENTQDRISQGVELMAAERFADAKALFQSVLAEDKGNYEGYINLGNACVNLEQFGEGVEAFKKALLAKPDSGEARYSLGCAYFLDGKNVEAVREFNRCEEQGYASAEMYGLLEVIFVDADDPVQAIRYANKAIQLEPLNAQHYIDKAQLYMLRDQTKEAAACLHEVEELLPDAGEPYLVEAQIHSQTGEHDSALAAIERGIARFPEDPTLLLGKGEALNNAERFAEALPVLAKACDLAAGNAVLINDISIQEAVALAGTRDLDGSIAALERAANSGVSANESLFMLITECAAAKRFESVERYCDRVLMGEEDTDPRTNAAAVFWKASAMKELGRSEEAAAAFKEAVGVLRRITIANPGLVEVYAYRLLCHMELGEYDKAIELADHIIQLAPEDATGYAFKSRVLEEKGDSAEAEVFRVKARELDANIEF